LQLTEEQILALAPDESSKKSGKSLAAASHWVSKGINDLALWGECQGSGSKPYQTQVDINNIAFKCSCPSRKFPCKHGLGLMLLYTRQQKDFTDHTPPAWVQDWISKRAQRQEKQAEKADKAKRQQARQSKVSDGVDELSLWLKDMMRNGILSMPEKGAPFFENMAKRMVDAQAPGLAGMVRGLGETNFYTEGWQSFFMDQVARIYLAIAAFKNMDRLAPLQQQDARNWIGFTQNQDELKELPGVTDTWLVLAKQVSEADNITTERNWLLGTTTNQYALVLQFVVRGQGAQVLLTPGMFIQAELAFYPSASPLRAIIKRQINSNHTSLPPAYESWTDVVKAETHFSSLLPVRGDRPYLINKLKPVLYNKQWWLQDHAQQIMQMKNETNTIWKLLSITGGEPATLVVIGREDRYEPVGVWSDDHYSIL
jgi:hypothetical protein